MYIVKDTCIEVSDYKTGKVLKFFKDAIVEAVDLRKNENGQLDFKPIKGRVYNIDYTVNEPLRSVVSIDCSVANQSKIVVGYLKDVLPWDFLPDSTRVKEKTIYGILAGAKMEIVHDKESFVDTKTYKKYTVYFKDLTDEGGVVSIDGSIPYYSFETSFSFTEDDFEEIDVMGKMIYCVHIGSFDTREIIKNNVGESN